MSTRLLARWLLTPLLTAAAFLAGNGVAYGQVFNPGQASVWGFGASLPTSGNWNNPNNWDVLPVSSANLEVAFQGTDQTITTAFPLNLSYLTFDGSATNGFVVNGGALNFVAGSVTFNSGGTQPLYSAISHDGITKGTRINSNINIDGAGGNTLNLVLGGNDGAAAELVLTGALTGSGNLTVRPGVSGFITSGSNTNAVLASKNNLNFTGNVLITGGNSLMLAGYNSFFRKNSISLNDSGASVLFTGTTSAAGNVQGFAPGNTGTNQQFGSVTGDGQLLLGTGSTAASESSTILVGYLNTAFTMSGSGSLSGQNLLSHFGKVGTGLMTISFSTVQSAYNAGLSVREGQLTIQGALGSIYSATPSAWTIYGGTRLRLLNTTGATDANGRLADLLPLQLAGGTLRMDSRSTAIASNNEIVGALRLYAGQSVIQVNIGAAGTAGNGRVTFGGTPTLSLGIDLTTLDRGGQLGVAGKNLGLGTGAAQSNVFFSATATAVNLGSIGGILPWTLAQSGYVGLNTGVDGVDLQNDFVPNTFAMYGANGLAPNTTFSPGGNVSATDATDLGPTINSVVISGAGAPVLGGVTTITSGALLSTATTGITGTGSITTGTARAYFSVAGPLATPPTLTIGVPVTAAGLSKGGNGTLILNGLTLTSPLLAINAGTLTLSSQPSGAGIVYQLAKGTTLNVPAAGLLVDGILRGAGTVAGVGTVTISATGTIGASALAGDLNTAALGASPELLTLSAPLAMVGGAKYRFYLSSVYGDTANDTSANQGRFTQAKIIGTTLDLSGASAGSPIIVQPFSLHMSNRGQDLVYDFDNTQTYDWVLGTFSGGFLGTFSSDKFSVNTANFQNLLGAGSFSVIQQGNNTLILHFGAAVPEPTLLGFAALGLAFVARRRMKA